MLHENIHPLGEVIVESCGNDIHGALHMVYWLLELSIAC
jgi:hypothetical protein